MSTKLLKGHKNRSLSKELGTLSSKATLSSKIDDDKRELAISVELEGICPEDWYLVVVLLKKVVLEAPWKDSAHMSIVWNEDASIEKVATALADEPLVILLRAPYGKRSPSISDPYYEIEKEIAGTVDLLPLFLGQNCVCEKVNLVYVESGEKTEYSVLVNVNASRSSPPMTAMKVTLLRAACIPAGKADSVYVAAVAMTNLGDIAPNIIFNASPVVTNKSIWASLAPVRFAAASDYQRPEGDVFLDGELKGSEDLDCNTVEWNMCRRLLVDPDLLKTHFSSRLFMEVAGLSKTGKPETRGHFMTVLDCKVLLEPGECGVVLRVPLRKYDSTQLTEATAPMLDLPPPNNYNLPTPVIPREMENITDESGHMGYVEIHFEVTTSVVSEPLPSELYVIMGKADQEVKTVIDDWIPGPPKPKPSLDVRLFKSECKALELHKSLDNSVCNARKHSRESALAAQRLLKRTKQLLRRHRADEGSFEFLDIVKGQHTAARRAVTSSLIAQPPSPRAPSINAATRARYNGNTKLADYYLTKALLAEPMHPRPLLSLTIRRLEKFDHYGAFEALNKALNNQMNNRFILWTFGALKSCQGRDGQSEAEAALRLAIDDNRSDGIRRSIAWAALHTYYHTHNNIYAAFVSARNMRKGSELPGDWVDLLDYWRKISGEEEHQWDPSTVSQGNRLVVAATMFLCLRLFEFSELLLQCADGGCAENGSRRRRDANSCCADVHYLRAASLLMQRRVKSALELIDQAISTYGPSCRFARLRLSCLTVCQRQWNKECEAALEETERFGAPADPAHLLRSAAVCSDFNVGLQRAGRAHMAAPSAQSAVVISRMLCNLGRDRSAERWAAAAVGLEPEEADGWAELALQLLQQQRLKEGRAALRSARQAGPISRHLFEEIETVRQKLGCIGFPELVSDAFCMCYQ